MESVFDAILPVFGILVIGYLAARFGFMEEAAVDGLSKFVFNFAVPLLLFRKIAQAGLPADMPWELPIAYYAGVIAIFLFAAVLGASLFRRGRAEAVSYGAAACYGNAVLMGIPVVLATYGDGASLPLFIIIGIHTLVMVPVMSLGYAFAGGKGRGLGGALGDIAGDLVRNPILIGLIAGLLYGRYGPPLPSVVDETTRLLGEASMPAALFAVGGTLARYSIGGQIPHALGLSVIKLVLLPLVVWLLADRLLGLPLLWMQVAVVLAALPSGVTAFLFASRYGAAKNTVTTTIILSTLLGLFTVPVAIWLIGR
ncbi:MAG: AEC family transporter [Alphaproteobacteria bacterium]|nr:AEC family transporter [Alphaproteobacteria bacterium]